MEEAATNQSQILPFIFLIKPNQKLINYSTSPDPGTVTDYSSLFMHSFPPSLPSTERREEITLPDELIKQVNCLDNLKKNVVASREAAIDSEGFRVLSAIGREQVESVQGELVRFDPVVYAEKLVTYMGGRRGDSDNLDWSKLGRRSMRVFRKVPTPTFL